MSHLEQRRTLPTAACAHALHVGCPHAPPARTGSAYPRRHWLQLTCAIACRCTARFRVLWVLAGCAGIAGFCAASLAFWAGVLSEAQYLVAVTSSMSVFAASVLVVHFGDPYERKRMECAAVQRGLPLQTHAERRVPSGAIASPPRAAMN